MSFLKKIGRFLTVSMFIILASFGLAFTGVNFRELFANKETRIEMVEKREDDIAEDEQKSIKE